MGAAYRAYDTSLRRPVALKTLHGPTDGASVRQLRREARAAADLHHPNICTVYAIEEHELGTFIVMEYVEGTALSELLRLGPVPPPNVARYAVDIANALAYAHARGVVHRDIKPSNVVVSSSGVVKVVDFGVARALPGSPALLTDESAPPSAFPPGTIAYMSAEQLEEGAEPDARSDIYSLGVLLYEMSTGTNPFLAKTTMATIARILTADVEPPSAGIQGFPAPLEEIILRCLDRDPERRPSGGGEIARTLQEASPVSTRPARRGDRKALAVLPFVDLEDRGDSYFSSGITSELIGRLARTEGLLVSSRTSTLRYRNSDKDPRTIGGELGVGAVVEGSVRLRGDSCTLNVQLVDARTGFSLWADRYEVPLEGLFDVQQEVSEQIAKALDAERPRREAVRLPTSDMRAFESYLRAVHAFNKFTNADNQVAIELLKDALARDPEYAEAHALLANVYVARVERGWDPEATKLLGLALHSCGLALQRNAGISSAHSARASINLASGALPEAEIDARSALLHDPNNDIAHDLLGRVLTFRGRFDEAIGCFERALRINRYYVWCLNDLAWVQWLCGHEAVDATLDRVIAISPGDEAAWCGKAGLLLLEDRVEEALERAGRAEVGNPNYPFVTMLMPLILARAGRVDEGLAHCRRTLEADPSSFTGRASEALVLAVRSDSEASDSLAAALELEPPFPPLSLNYAVLYDFFGQRQAALRWIRKAEAEGVRPSPEQALHPGLESLRRELRTTTDVGGRQ